MTGLEVYGLRIEEAVTVLLSSNLSEIRNPTSEIRHLKLASYTLSPGLHPIFRVQLFLTLNDLAGRYPLLDAFMRGVYILTVPLLAVILLGLLILAPRAPGAPSRGKVALATVVALAGAALLMWGIDAWAQSLGTGTLSPRPWMTRWVNLLIIEPQDNSFPCVEVMLAAITSVGIWAAHRWWGVFAALATLLLMVARLFCGSNYLADVGVAALVGVGLMLFCLALCRAPRSRKWRAGLAGIGAFTLGGTALATFIVMAAMPRFAGKMQLPWGTAAPSAALSAHAPTAARDTLQEGEGIPTLDTNNDGTIKADEYAGEAETEALSKRATLFLPKDEAALTQILAPKAAPFRLVDVEVAPVNFSDGSYRAAAIRFDIDTTIPNVRQLVAQRAAILVKAAFAADAKLDNVDITGVVTGDTAQSADSLMNFVGDEVPVFTASIQRRNLIVANPKWANAPNLEGGLWLRTRSRLWIDDKFLPKTPEVPTPTAAPTAMPATAPPTAATPPASATPNVKATPTIVPPTAQASPKPTALAQPSPRPTVKATARPKIKPRRKVRPRRPRRLRRARPMREIV